MLQVLTDDLDVMMNSSHRAWLPKTWAKVADQGTVFRNMLVRRDSHEYNLGIRGSGCMHEDDEAWHAAWVPPA